MDCGLLEKAQTYGDGNGIVLDGLFLGRGEQSTSFFFFFLYQPHEKN